MLNKKKSIKEKILLLLKQKGYLEFLITTFAILLLTILGIFTSHYNSDKFIGRIKVYETVVTPVNTTDKVVGEVSIKVTTVTFNEVHTLPLRCCMIESCDISVTIPLIFNFLLQQTANLNFHSFEIIILDHTSDSFQKIEYIT